MEEQKDDLSYLINFFQSTFFREPSEKDNQRNKTIKKAFRKFSESGWIPPRVKSFELSTASIINLSTKSTKYVDDYIYSLFLRHRQKECKRLIKRLKNYSYANSEYFLCAMILYKEKRYLGCSLMTLALIEQQIRYFTKRFQYSVPTSTHYFMEKTFRNSNIPCRGYPENPEKFRWSVSLTKVLEIYFLSTNNFEIEFPEINRTFLMHGMAQRKYTHRDCIKLFLTLDYICECIQKGESTNGKSTT